MNRFFIYKEYGAKYEMMIKDVGSAHQSMPQWDSYQRGLEVLASILSSAKTAEEKSKKALTIGDLLVKVTMGRFDGGEWRLTRSKAHTESMQIPSTVRRAAQAHTSVGLPELAHGA